MHRLIPAHCRLIQDEQSAVKFSHLHQRRIGKTSIAETPLALIMGFWSSSDKALSPAPRISSDGAPIAPDRSQRAKCWEARDAYFRCLDKNGIVDSLSEKDKAEKGCAVEGRGFEANCASSWVS